MNYSIDPDQSTPAVSFAHNGRRHGGGSSATNPRRAYQAASHSQRTNIQHSRPIPIPSSNQLCTDRLPDYPSFSTMQQNILYQDRGRTSQRRSSLAHRSANQRHQRDERVAVSHSRFTPLGSASDSSGSNSSSGNSGHVSQGSNSSDIFHFSPPGSLERRGSQQPLAQMDPVPFLYTPPQTGRSTQQVEELVRCQACGRRIQFLALNVHGQVCDGRRRSPRSNTVAMSSRQHNSSSSSSENEPQRAHRSDQQRFPANALGDLNSSSSYQHANTFYRPSHGPYNSQVYPQINHYAASSFSTPSSAVPPDFNRPPYNYLP
ncbi:uncharacterized protein FOMMEDRAFT_160753 [Fomitiporia mediterranea MF3/22]|uniref:uncharacterized protein n=1 Tax=Fomitiporia mediterranea (strain MF3/22) TaxID=694068 RepID=UPI0004408B48|nr:uncharacterized protein FOMMEDRAFT_160753 [Fomitiporia mediterranea MF3/22]EJC99182.1 hypothetical protein FOMMEDRAFT_160753 [Fomitiporia mediterranea MF3/22]